MQEAHGLRLTAVVLAAGRSSRMGAANKLLLDVGGAPVLSWVLSAFASLPAFETVVVTGAERERVAAVARRQPDVRVVHNPDYRTGMASSLRRGVRAASARSDGLAICPGDLPRLSSSVVERLCGVFAGQPPRIVRPTCDGRPGHPVLFPRAFRPALLRLVGDSGARAVLEQNERCVTHVETGEPGIFLDVDTPEALEALRQNWRETSPASSTRDSERSTPHSSAR